MDFICRFQSSVPDLFSIIYSPRFPDHIADTIVEGSTLHQIFDRDVHPVSPIVTWIGGTLIRSASASG